jgi:hypothetical protein
MLRGRRGRVPWRTVKHSSQMAAAEHRRLAAAYREMAVCWRGLLANPGEAQRCLDDAEHHEREAERIEREGEGTPYPEPRAGHPQQLALIPLASWAPTPTPPPRGS